MKEEKTKKKKKLQSGKLHFNEMNCLDTSNDQMTKKQNKKRSIHRIINEVDHVEQNTKIDGLPPIPKKRKKKLNDNASTNSTTEKHVRLKRNAEDVSTTTENEANTLKQNKKRSIHRMINEVDHAEQTAAKIDDLPPIIPKKKRKKKLDDNASTNSTTEKHVRLKRNTGDVSSTTENETDTLKQNEIVTISKVRNSEAKERKNKDENKSDEDYSEIDEWCGELDPESNAKYVSLTSQLKIILSKMKYSPDLHPKLKKPKIKNKKEVSLNAPSASSTLQKPSSRKENGNFKQAKNNNNPKHIHFD